jgi:poly(A) polymerase Pap1
LKNSRVAQILYQKNRNLKKKKIMEKVIKENKLNEEEIKKIEKIIKKIKSILEKYCKEKNTIQYKLYTIGSYRLKVNTKTSDLDLCIIGTEENEEFNKNYTNFLEIEKETEEEEIKIKTISNIEDSLIPIINIRINTMEIDISYCKIQKEEIPEKLLNYNIESLSKISKETINGIRECEYIENVIKGREEIFINFFYIIQYWAKRKGLYSGTLCYFSGYTWKYL